MTHSPKAETLNRKAVFSVSLILVTTGLRLIYGAIFRSRDWESFSSAFAEVYSSLWDYAEHSISHQGFTLPTFLGDAPVHNVNRLLSKLYGAEYACLSMNGSSGALLTILTAVLPKLHTDRDLILFDDMCHQSAIGGLIFGRWNAVRLPRKIDRNCKTVRPLSYEVIKKTIDENGANRIAAILLVSPCYDGFSSPTEVQKIYALAKSSGITVIVDGAWDSIRFRQPNLMAPRIESICDIWITSPHKRGLTPSSIGCIMTHSQLIAKLWDEALDLGFRSSSVSFVDIMIAEHRLQQVVNGDWDAAFSMAEKGAKLLLEFIPTLHPSLEVIDPEDVSAETTDPAHILISTHRLPDFDARKWAQTLSSEFGLDVEKSTASTLLLLCGSPEHFRQLEQIKTTLKKSFQSTLKLSGAAHDNPPLSTK